MAMPNTAAPTSTTAMIQGSSLSVLHIGDGLATPLLGGFSDDNSKCPYTTGGYQYEREPDTYSGYRAQAAFAITHYGIRRGINSDRLQLPRRWFWWLGMAAEEQAKATTSQPVLASGSGGSGGPVVAQTPVLAEHGGTGKWWRWGSFGSNGSAATQAPQATPAQTVTTRMASAALAALAAAGSREVHPR